MHFLERVFKGQLTLLHHQGSCWQKKKKKKTQGDSGLPIVQGCHDRKALAVSLLGAQETVVLGLLNTQLKQHIAVSRVCEPDGLCRVEQLHLAKSKLRSARAC